ncbi:hypothetical protein [Sphaerisporangium dianthi]|uniref:Uncharacterized protein n=1 Tax=Sphaerisporangium dianthi TaxID=1436120 RepID=A0ABV9CAB4_9ACTN
MNRAFALPLPRRKMARRHLRWMRNNLLEEGFTTVDVDHDGLRARDAVRHNSVAMSLEPGLFGAQVHCETHGPDAEDLKVSILRWHHDFVAGALAWTGGRWWMPLLHLARWAVLVSVPLVAGLAVWYITNR